MQREEEDAALISFSQGLGNGPINHCRLISANITKRTIKRSFRNPRNRYI